jgi:hypothetical protein
MLITWSIRSQDLDLARNDGTAFPKIREAAAERLIHGRTIWTPAHLVVLALAELDRYKIRTYVRSPDAPFGLADRAQAWGRGLIALPHDWNEPDAHSVAGKGTTLVHERRHAVRFRVVGRRAAYLVMPGRRWAEEMMAYRDDVRAWLAIGGDVDRIARRIDSIAEDFDRKYLCARLRNVETATRRVLLEAIGR